MAHNEIMSKKEFDLKKTLIIRNIYLFSVRFFVNFFTDKIFSTFVLAPEGLLNDVSTASKVV